MLQVVAERRIRGAVERTYTLRLYAAQIQPGEVAAMTTDEHAQAFMAYVAGLLADFDRYLAAGVPDPVRDGAAYRVAAMWLTEAEFADFLRDLQELAQPRLANAPGKGRRRRMLYSVLLPEPELPATSHEPDRAPDDPKLETNRESMMETNPAATSLAVLEMAQAGRFAQIHEMFAPQLRPMVTAEAIQDAWAAELGRRGQVASIGTPVSEPAQGGVVVVRVPVTCEHGELAVVISVTEAGQLAGIQLAPASAAEPIAPWEPPGYADPDTFDEQDLMVGPGRLAVPGTLSLPRQSGPRAAVVLLPGSGPMDRDETIGRNKPFKDLAWGLASAGVAVLRFDKVTYAHPSEVNEAGDVTVVEEYVTHAAAAIHLLRAHPAVDAGRVFVLGHSLGGTIAPRVAAGEPSVAGLVILAGGTQPLHWAAVRQVRYLASLDPETAAASQPAIEVMTRAATMVDSPGLSASTPASELPFGVPASYWLDLRGYMPVEVAAALGRPMLILQGGRDYQATVADDLAGWKAGLAHSPNVTIIIYDPDNHLFFPGTGPSTPAEYEPAQHMDPAVVADIASWLTKAVDTSDVSSKGPAR